MVTNPIFYLSTDYPRESILVGVVQHATTGLWYTGERRTKRPSMMEHLVTTNVRDINKDFTTLSVLCISMVGDMQACFCVLDSNNP